MSDNLNDVRTMPLLALRGLSVFPGMLLTFDVERSASAAALDAAVRTDQMIFLAAQKDPIADAPDESEIYHTGTVCRIRQQLRQPRGGFTRVMVEGVRRAQAESVDMDGKYYTAQVRMLDDRKDRVSEARREALLRSCFTLFEEYIHANPDMVNEQILNLLANPSPSYVSDYIAHNVRLSVEDKQELLEELSPCRRLAMLAKLLTNELNIISIEKEISDAAQEAMNQNQREYYLREELKAIQAELGDDGQTDDIGDYRAKINALPVPEEVRTKLLKELGRLSKQPFGSSEAAVLRGYLDVCLEIPWGVTTKETVDVAKARRLLDEEHFGLDKVKERVLEYLSVRQLTPDVKGGLICLVGPPGTGKTSIAMSIARATNRKLCRVSLGGVHDEAEIRGHRKTYIGSMPGRIVSGIIQSGSINPLMVLDEIDKLGSDYRGDPSAALLEALDGEQNSTFRDNFLEIPIDLSGVFFITTANTTDTIPRALLDRMEVIELHSYTDEDVLGPARYKPEPFRFYDEVGLVHGLAYTSVGGEMLDVEALVTDGSGKLELTGNLGDVMKESARAAVSFIRSRAAKLGIDPEFYKNRDIHIHYPEGAIPKDGPSAGVTTCVALVSALTGRPVRHDVAMTGEITLRGRVLPIGGLREKTMAALRSGVKTVIIPAENQPDLEEIDQTVRAALSFIPVSYADEALEAALVPERSEGVIHTGIMPPASEKPKVRQ